MIIECHGCCTTILKPHHDTKRCIGAIEWLEPAGREKIFETDVGKVYPRFDARTTNRA
jgi:hypothetical protein